MIDQNPSRLVVTFSEAAKNLAISLRQFRRLVDLGKIPVVTISERCPRVRMSDLLAYLDRNSRRHGEPARS